MSSTLSYLSESGKLFIQKKSLPGTVTELFSTLRFSVKHRGSVPVTTVQQTFCSGNLEQGGGEDLAPSVLRKATLWNDSRNC